jgi:hypothetical protein
MIGNYLSRRRIRVAEWAAQGIRLMASFENSGIGRGLDGVAAAAVFRKLGMLCTPDAAAPLPHAMAALLERLRTATPQNGEQPQLPVETP